MPYWETRSNHIGKLLHHPTSERPAAGERKGQTRRKRAEQRQREEKDSRERSEKTNGARHQPKNKTDQTSERPQEGGIKGIKSTCLKSVGVICLRASGVPRPSTGGDKIYCCSAHPASAGARSLARITPLDFNQKFRIPAGTHSLQSTCNPNKIRTRYVPRKPIQDHTNCQPKTMQNSQRTVKPE